MYLINLILVLTLLLNHICRGSDLEYDGKLNIRLDHSFDQTQNPEYFHRGDIFIKSLHLGISSIEELPLTNEQSQLLKNVAKTNGNYRVRATIKNTDNSDYLYYTFVKSCSLLESHLTNFISINLDHNGNVIAVTMAVPKICTGADVSSTTFTNFNTTVVVRHMDLGPVPDTATYIQKLEKEREAKERGETKDNRSFLAKYWIYILPVVIFMLLPSATNPESGGASAQR